MSNNSTSGAAEDAPLRPKEGPPPSIYGSRWGPGATLTPHNQPGSIASDPASAPAPATPVISGPDAAIARWGEPPAPDAEEVALQEIREQRWDGEGGALSRRS